MRAVEPLQYWAGKTPIIGDSDDPFLAAFNLICQDSAYGLVPISSIQHIFMADYCANDSRLATIHIDNRLALVFRWGMADDKTHKELLTGKPRTDLGKDGKHLWVTHFARPNTMGAQAACDLIAKSVFPDAPVIHFLELVFKGGVPSWVVHKRAGVHYGS